MLEDAFDCIRGVAPISGVGATVLAHHRGKIAIAAINWVKNDSEEVSSFRWCCYSLGWEYPEQVRKHILQFTNRDIIHVAQTLKFSIWKNKSAPTKSYRCSFEIEGRKINMGNYPTQRAAERALRQEYLMRTKNGQ